MAEIYDREDLERWLMDRPREDAEAIAARAALRVAPLLVTALDYDAEAGLAAIVLPVFRAMAAPWVAAVGPPQGAAVRKAAATAARVGTAATTAATTAAATAATTAAAHAAHAAAAAAAADVAAHTAQAAAAAYTAARTTAAAFAASAAANAWEAVSADATALEQGQSSERVAGTPLWPETPPAWAAEAWTGLADHLLKADEGWEVWTEWYEDRLHGRPYDKALEEARVLIDAELWEQGPKAVNAEIARLIEVHDDRADDIDFFISYSVPDEAYARWAARVLFNNGYSVFAQFNDMLPGSNFVMEMHRGLTKSGRMLAILSQDFLDSKACRSEWASAFNLDRDGSARKLIPIMVRPCTPGGLLAQIVYKRLVGLSGDEAAKALLDAIGHNQLVETIPDSWPGNTSEAEDEITSAVGDATPQGRRVEIDPSSGKVAAKAPDQRPTAPAEISNDAVLGNLCRKILRRTKRFSDGSQSDQYVRLQPILDMLDDAITNGSNDPLWLHDDIEQAHREIVDLIRIGDLPETRRAPELAAFRLDLRNGLADLRRVYPALADMAGHRRTAHARPLTEAEQKALELALDAFEEIVDEKLQSELREDAAAVLDAEPVALEPDLPLPDGRLKDRLYRLAGMFIRVYRLAKTPAERLRQIFDEGVDVAKRIKDYERAKETLAPIWRELRDWLLDFFS